MGKVRSFNDITKDLCKQNEVEFLNRERQALAVAQRIIDSTPPEKRRQILESCCKRTEG